MHAPTWSTRPHLGTRLLPALFLGLCLAVVVATAWLERAPAGHSGDASHPPSTKSPMRVGAAAPGAATTEPAERQVVPDEHVPARPLASFEELVEQLVALGTQVAEFAQQDEIDAAKAS